MVSQTRCPSAGEGTTRGSCRRRQGQFAALSRDGITSPSLPSLAGQTGASSGFALGAPVRPAVCSPSPHGKRCSSTWAIPLFKFWSRRKFRSMQIGSGVGQVYHSSYQPDSSTLWGNSRAIAPRTKGPKRKKFQTSSIALLSLWGVQMLHTCFSGKWAFPWAWHYPRYFGL